jgi:ribonuclease P protein component
VGITVTRKVAGSVGRNRIRRRVREAFRRSHAELPLGLELVIVAKHDALQASWLEIFEEISGTARSLARAEAPL